MMESAERHGELVAHPAAQCGALGKSQVMRVRWSPTAQQARLQGHELEVIAVAVAPRLAQGEVGFVDPWSRRLLRDGFLPIRHRERQGSVECESAGVWFQRRLALA